MEAKISRKMPNPSTFCSSQKLWKAMQVFLTLCAPMLSNQKNKFLLQELTMYSYLYRIQTTNQEYTYGTPLLYKRVSSYLELLPLNWWTWASIFLKSTFCWSLNQTYSPNENERDRDSGREREGETHRARERSWRSLSESSKKRETTSNTKSGLVSSWSIWSWLNWPSKNPFTKITQHLKISKKNQILKIK